MVLQFSLHQRLFSRVFATEFCYLTCLSYFVPFPSPKDTSKERKSMAPNKSSPLAGILMTAFFGTISIILAAITMYQVHSIWVRYHHRQRQENQAAGTYTHALPVSDQVCCRIADTPFRHRVAKLCMRAYYRRMAKGSQSRHVLTYRRASARPHPHLAIRKHDYTTPSVRRSEV